MTTTIDGYETKNCPFCGSDKLRIRYLHGWAGGTGIKIDKYEVACDLCDCDGPIASNKQTAVEMWNERHDTEE